MEFYPERLTVKSVERLYVDYDGSVTAIVDVTKNDEGFHVIGVQVSSDFVLTSTLGATKEEAIEIAIKEMLEKR